MDIGALLFMGMIFLIFAYVLMLRNEISNCQGRLCELEAKDEREKNRQELLMLLKGFKMN